MIFKTLRESSDVNHYIQKRSDIATIAKLLVLTWIIGLVEWGGGIPDLQQRYFCTFDIHIHHCTLVISKRDRFY